MSCSRALSSSSLNRGISCRSGSAWFVLGLLLVTLEGMYGGKRSVLISGEYRGGGEYAGGWSILSLRVSRIRSAASIAFWVD